jgi:hypothetical protein
MTRPTRPRRPRKPAELALESPDPWHLPPDYRLAEPLFPDPPWLDQAICSACLQPVDLGWNDSLCAACDSKKRDPRPVA